MTTGRKYKKWEMFDTRDYRRGQQVWLLEKYMTKK